MTLIVIDGLDGSGKATQSALLAGHFENLAVSVSKISFPMYDKPSGALVKSYLAGEFGENPADTGPYAASAMFALDRYISYQTDWHKLDGVVIADRYTTANAIHQMTKIPQSQWDEFLAWLHDFEHVKLGLPTPDLVIYLDLPHQMAQNLVKSRSDSTGQKIDIHERDTSHLERSREAGLYAAEKLGWHVIRCNDGDTLLPRQEIFAEIIAAAKAVVVENDEKV